MGITKELAELRSMDHAALAVEAFVLRERLRHVQSMAERALEKHRKGDPIALICDMHNLSIRCDLLPENRATEPEQPSAAS